MTPRDIYWLTDWQIQHLYLAPTFDFIGKLTGGNNAATPMPAEIEYDPDKPPVSRLEWEKHYRELGAGSEHCEREWARFLAQWRETCEAKRKE